MNQTLKNNGIGVLAIVLFAAGFPAADLLLVSWDPVALMAIRLVLTVALLAPIWILLDGPKAVFHADWSTGLVIGGIGFGAGTLLLLVAQDFTNAVTASLIAASMPIVAITLEVLFDGRRLRPHFLLGVVLVILGGVYASGASLAEADFGYGAIAGFFAALLFAGASRLTVKRLDQMSNMGQATLTMIGAMIFNLFAFVLCSATGLLPTTVGALSGSLWISLLIYALCGLAISQIFWVLSVARLGIGIASFHLNLTPFYVMIILVILGSAWNWTQAIGATIVVAGVSLSQIRWHVLKNLMPGEKPV